MRSFDAPVTAYMQSPVCQVKVDDDVTTAYERLVERRISAVLVVGRFREAAGVLSRHDLLAVGHVRSRGSGRPTLLDLPAMCAGDLMSHPVVTVPVDAIMRDAARVMVEKHIHRVFVLDDDSRALGVLSTRDVIAAVADARSNAPIERVMSSPVVSVDVSASLGQALGALEHARVGGVVVTEGGEPVGLFTEVEALESRSLARGVRVEEVMTPALLCLSHRMPLSRAAAFAVGTRARRIIAVDHRQMVGIVSGMDFARLVAE
jgi:CBS domain-containing protein